MLAAYSGGPRLHEHIKCLLILLSLLVSDCRYLPPFREYLYHQKPPDHSGLGGIYSFSYDTGNGEYQSFRWESRSEDGTTSGEYGYVDPDGLLRVTKYTADRFGYRAKNSVYHPVSLFPRNPSLIIGLLPQQRQSKPPINSYNPKRQETFREPPVLRNNIPPLPMTTLRMSCPLGNCIEPDGGILEDRADIIVPPRNLIIGPIPGHLLDQLGLKKFRHRRKVTNKRFKDGAESSAYYD